MSHNGTNDRENDWSLGWWIAVLLAAGIYGCGAPRSAQTVHYRLPNDYRGPFKIILDENRGVTVQPKDGRYVYEIPASGLLRVKSFAPFRVMHEETAEYSDGRPLVIPNSTVGGSVIALRDLAEYTRGSGPRTILMLIGTEAEVAKLRQEMADPNFDPPPPKE